jgi:von Willebrand factor type A domain
VPRCSQCSRLNPDGSSYCFFDGRSLGAASKAAPVGRFATPFVFPSGRACRTFDELANASLDDWPTALRLLGDGTLTAYLGRIGRLDLATLSRRAATLPDADAGLDEVLRGWPTDVIEPARLHVAQAKLDVGRLAVGQQGEWHLKLRNEGMGQLRGTVSSDVPWLAVGDGPSGPSRHFGCLESTTVPIRLVGNALRASTQRMVGRLRVATNGGEAVVEVVAQVPPVPFREGPLAGATTPRQIAEKAKANPRDAAPLFSGGAVARWYAVNGWTYPVEGEAADGLAAVQQFFEALGLSSPPRLVLSEPSLSLAGAVGSSIAHTLRLSTSEKRPVYARATSDQPWLNVQRVRLDGADAHIDLGVAAVPQQPGQTLQASVTIHANARQQFVVPVRLRIDSTPPVAGNLDWLPGAPVQSSPEVVAARPPVWAPLRREAISPQPGRNEPTPVVLAPARQPMSAAHLWMLAIPICLVAILAVVGTLVAVASSRSPKQTLAQAEAGKEPSAVEKELVPPDDPPVPRKPLRTTKPLIGIRARDGDGIGKPPLLLPEIEAREVEVVFCLDTTGSMGGLLDGAKKKIWAICNQIAGGGPTPSLRVGLVAYRDKGDDYVTKVFDLSRDLDSIYTNLEALSAGGGGDIPESVNQALDDAVNKVSWSKDKRTLKIIFLVGDAPPHMDYDDDVKYPVTCKKALDQGIFINSIQCGNDADCRRTWKDIAEKSASEFVTIPLTGGVVTIPTAHDRALIDLGGKLFASALIYGDGEQKRRGEAMVTAAKRLVGPTGADRVAFAAKSRRIGPFDLIDAMRTRKVKVEDIPEAELPDSLKDLTAAERRDFVEKVTRERADFYADAIEREKKRAEALAEDLTKRGGGKDSFDSKVLEILRKQAKKFDISY